ncbi:MAG: histidine kinase [Polaromonas sp.]|nr:histidine kinase [Polaromonas sp.]
MGVNAAAATTQFSHALATVTVEGNTTQASVPLPYNWDRMHKGQFGTATFDMVFKLTGESTEPYAIYLVRLGNAYEISLNGVVLERNGDLQRFDGADFGQVPRMVMLPSLLLQEDNQLRIRIKADVGRRAGVPVILLGYESEIDAVYTPAYRWRVVGSEVVMILSLLVGIMALALWFTQTHVSRPHHLSRDTLYLFAGLAELCWAMRVSTVLIERPPVPWFIWGPLSAIALGGWVCFIVAFCCTATGWAKHPWAVKFFRFLWLLLCLGIPATFFAYVWQLPWLLTLWYGTLAAVVLPFAIFYGWATWKSPSAMRMTIAGAVVLNFMVGTRDFVVFRLTDSFGSDTYTRYSSVVFGLTLGYIVVTRFRNASRQARDLTATLSARVAQKEKELEQSFQRLGQLAREQERSAERARILGDMHDGVGAHISTAIRQLESGRASQSEVLQTLRDSLDQLKLSIDAMNLPPGDITALLANLRYRLGPRFTACDIELVWDVDLLPPVARLDDQAMRQLQFMVFEALSNVLQHAHASELRIELRATDQGAAKLRVIDNGCGFDPQQVKRRGLSSLSVRAIAIGAELDVVSQPGHTAVEITLL